MPALTNLGYCYTYGIGVEQDYAKALECFRKGAEQGFPRAQFLLQLLLINGQEEGSPAVGADIRLLLHHIAAVAPLFRRH